MDRALEFISRETNGFQPEIGIVLGSGLGEIADEHCKTAIPYNEIPGFIHSNVIGHKGRLVFADIKGKKVVMMQGRNHYYEGYSLEEITFPIKVMKHLGVKTLILTNAAGAINESFHPGDLMLITDHINHIGVNPLRGTNDEDLGERFPDMSEVYKKHLIEKTDKYAKKLGFDLQHGVYMANSGPSYETPAEIKMARIMGADAVGMSTVPEAIVGNYCGMDILGISCITNYASGVSETKLTHTEVIETANKVKERFKSLIVAIISG